MRQVILYFIFFTACFATQTNAQVRRLSLEKCIEHAINNNIDIKTKEKDLKRKEIELSTNKNSWLPNLNAGIEENFNFGRSPSTEGIYLEQNSSNTSFGAQLNMPLFDGFKIHNNIESSKLNLNASVESLNKAKEDLSIKVTSSFLQVLYNKEIMKISQMQVSLTEEKVKETDALVETGRVPLAQLYDIKAQLAKDKLTLVESNNNTELALLDLLQLLELERSDANYDIVSPQTEDILKEYMGSILPPKNIYNNAVIAKPHIKEQEYLLESQKKLLKVAQADYYPKLDFNLSYLNGYYHYYDSDKNESFSDQIKRNEQKIIGFTLSIPIFNRFAVRNNVRMARVNISNQELVIENTKKALYKEIQQAYYNAIGAQEKYLASREAVTASKEALQYAEDRYLTGKNSVFEYNDTKTKYTQSLYERAQAKYEYIFRAKILDYYNGVPITLQ